MGSKERSIPHRPLRPRYAFTGALPKIFRAYLNFTKRYGMIGKDLCREEALTTHSSIRAQRIRKRIEVVITSRTRNAVVRKGTWVRIPPLPPSKKSVIKPIAGFLLFLNGLSGSFPFPLPEQTRFFYSLDAHDKVHIVKLSSLFSAYNTAIFPT